MTATRFFLAEVRLSEFPCHLLNPLFVFFNKQNKIFQHKHNAKCGIYSYFINEYVIQLHKKKHIFMLLHSLYDMHNQYENFNKIQDQVHFQYYLVPSRIVWLLFSEWNNQLQKSLYVHENLEFCKSGWKFQLNLKDFIEDDYATDINSTEMANKIKCQLRPVPSGVLQVQLLHAQLLVTNLGQNLITVPFECLSIVDA